MTFSLNQSQLISKLKKKDERSFATFYDLYSQKVFNLTFRITGDKQDAEDITQEVFITAFQKIDDFNEKSDIYTWLYSITRNKCFRFLEKKKRASFSDLEKLINSVPKDQEPEYKQAEKNFYINQVKEGCLNGLLKCLSFYQRVAFILNVLLEVDISQVSQIIGKSEGATRVLIYRARNNIKKFLCKNCSLYDPKNKCECENFISFSLEQKWIQKPSGSKDLTQAKIIENEIGEVDKVVSLYKTLPSQEVLRTLKAKIFDSSSHLIFSKKKV